MWPSLLPLGRRRPKNSMGAKHFASLGFISGILFITIGEKTNAENEKP